VTIEGVRLHPQHQDKEVVVVLSRGSSKAVSTNRPRKALDQWGDTLNLVATLYRDKHGRYQEKKCQIVVKQGGASGKVLATLKFDASAFAAVGGIAEKTVLKNPKEDAEVKVRGWCTSHLSHFGLMPLLVCVCVLLLSADDSELHLPEAVGGPGLGGVQPRGRRERGCVGLIWSAVLCWALGDVCVLTVVVVLGLVWWQRMRSRT
jgi:hypothetical protein